MDSLETILENPMLRETHSRQRAELRERFPELADCPHDHFLFLRKYTSQQPQCFYSVSTYTKFLSWLDERDKKSRSALKTYLIDSSTEIDRAIHHLEEINELEWHDHFEKLDEYQYIRFIDQGIHPTYLRLAESVFTQLCRVVAYFSRIDRGKGTDGLELLAIVEEVERTRVSDIVGPYHHVMRNAIAHGGITYLQQEIRYQDKRMTKKFHVDEVIRTFDDLLDVCNGLTLALSMFLLSHLEDGYKLPGQILLTELREETRAPWWEIVGCTPSEMVGLNQLIIYARPKTADYGKVQLSTFQSGVLAERFAPGYDRYFFSIRSTSSWPGWATFDGKKLRALRSRKDVALEDYAGVQDLLFYHTPWRLKVPKFLRRLHHMVMSARLHWPLVVSDMRKQMGWPTIDVRDTKIHRNAWRCVVTGSVYFRGAAGDVTQDEIRRFRRKIVVSALRGARCQHTSRYSLLRYLPLGFGRIGVFQRNYRRRRFPHYGLDEDLICTVQLQRIRRIRSPDIFGATIEKHGRHRIAWNHAWLDTRPANSVQDN